VRRGEILGIAGISGNGQAELLAALSGETTGPADTVAGRHAGGPPGRRPPAQARPGFVPEERLAAVPCRP
jgi:simple sugar transport system ATP-binding protein